MTDERALGAGERAAEALADFARSRFADTREMRWATMNDEQRQYFRDAVSVVQSALRPQPSPSVASAPESEAVEQSFCNKCGFFGCADADGFHRRPKDGEACNYTARRTPASPQVQTAPDVASAPGEVELRARVKQVEDWSKSADGPVLHLAAYLATTVHADNWPVIRAYLSAAFSTPPASSQASVAGEVIDLLTKAVGDISAALTMAGKEAKIEAWTAPYVAAINSADAAAIPAATDEQVEAVARIINPEAWKRRAEFQAIIDGTTQRIPDDPKKREMHLRSATRRVDAVVANSLHIARSALAAALATPPATDEQVEAAVRRAAKALGKDYDEVCGHDADGGSDDCDSETCIGNLSEDHDADHSRDWVRTIAIAALSTPRQSREQAFPVPDKETIMSDTTTKLREILTEMFGEARVKNLSDDGKPLFVSLEAKNVDRVDFRCFVEEKLSVTIPQSLLVSASLSEIADFIDAATPNTNAH